MSRGQLSWRIAEPRWYDGQLQYIMYVEYGAWSHDAWSHVQRVYLKNYHIGEKIMQCSTSILATNFRIDVWNLKRFWTTDDIFIIYWQTRIQVCTHLTMLDTSASSKLVSYSRPVRSKATRIVIVLERNPRNWNRAKLSELDSGVAKRWVVNASPIGFTFILIKP